MRPIPNREKLILSGLYLSKYDLTALERLGYEGFVEAFNVIGGALGAKPASIKNYRDEFDPHFSNRRRGWHKRPMRLYCRDVFEEYKDLDFESFTNLIGSFFGLDENAWGNFDPDVEPDRGASAFAKRLITGLAAERYFEAAHPGISEFQGYAVENTTRFGCGYDFRLRNAPHQNDFLAVEVKGLTDQTGTVSMTAREYEAATTLRHRFFLFVVRNFRESPFHEIYADPASGVLDFKRTERIVTQVSWMATV